MPDGAAFFDFYGAGVSLVRPGGGEPSRRLLPEVQVRLTCVLGTAELLIPAEVREAIGDALRRVDPTARPLRCVECAGADHGFMCESCSSFYLQASSQRWRLLLCDDPVA